MNLQLLGTPRVWYGAEAVDLPTSRATLLALYLATEGAWVTRKKLAHFFRPEADEASARHYVRKMLCAVKAYPWAAALEIEKDRLRWNVDTDVKELEAAIKAGNFQEAVEYYQGPFLDQVEITDSPNFEGWLEERREHLHVLWQDSCLRHATELEGNDQHQEAANVARSVLLSDSLAESALQTYIRNTYLAGNRVLALQEATRFTEELERETGLRPLPETLKLMGAITRAESVVGPKISLQPGPQATEQRHGTEPQLERLSRVLRDPRVRFLSIQHSDENRSLVVSLRLRDAAFVLEALVNLAEQLAAQGHHQRCHELIQTVVTSRIEDSTTLARAQQLKIWLDSHTLGEPQHGPPHPMAT